MSSQKLSSPKPLHIALTGLDGTGKSTHALLLKRFLITRGWHPVIIHHYSPLSALMKSMKKLVHDQLIVIFKRAKVHKDYTTKQPRKTRQVSHSFAQLISWCLIIDGFWKSWYHWIQYRKRCLIYDRCFLDDLVKAQWRFGGGWNVGTFLLHYVPKPDIIFALETPLPLAYSRKKVKNCTFEEFVVKNQLVERSLSLAENNGWSIHRIQVGELGVQEVFTQIQARLEPLLDG